MFNNVIQSRAAKWGLLASVLAVFALFSGFCLPGCSNNPATSPESDLSQDDVSFFDLPFSETELAKAVNDDDTDVEVIFAEDVFAALDGGSLTIIDKVKLYEFVVPPNALTSSTEISVEIIELKGKVTGSVDVIYDFAPDGLVFKETAWLYINVKKVLGPKAESVRFFYLNENTSEWEFQGEYYPDASGIACLPIDHFSRYGTTR